jgi:hypothetical protein
MTIGIFNREAWLYVEIGGRFPHILRGGLWRTDDDGWIWSRRTPTGRISEIGPVEIAWGRPR